MIAFKNPLFWLFLCLWSEVMYPCFVQSYLSTQKLVRIVTEKRQNSLRVDHTIAFILLLEQMRHLSCTSTGRPERCSSFVDVRQYIKQSQIQEQMCHKLHPTQLWFLSVLSLLNISVKSPLETQFFLFFWIQKSFFASIDNKNETMWWI